MKKYQVKDKYEKAAKKIIGHFIKASPIVFSENSCAYNDLFAYGVLEEFCEEVSPQIEEWQEPYYPITLSEYLPLSIEKKMRLLGRMQSWANYHNELDGFVPDWSNDNIDYPKYGIVIESGKSYADVFFRANIFLFQIAVSSRERAREMHEYFKKDIQELINLKAI